MQLLQGRPHKIAWENNKTNLNNNGPYPKNKGAACYWSSSKIRGSRELSTILEGGGGYLLGLDSLCSRKYWGWHFLFCKVRCVQIWICYFTSIFSVCQFPVSTWSVSWKMILYSRPKLSDLLPYPCINCLKNHSSVPFAMAHTYIAHNWNGSTPTLPRN